MKTLPNDYLEASASASRKYHIYVAVGTIVNGFYEDTYEYDENDIISLKIVFGATTGGFAIGETICGTLEMTVSRNFNVADGNRITVYVAFETATGSLTARQKIGRFYIDKLSRTEFTQNFTAYDKMIQQEKVFIQGVALEYPTTVSLMLDRIADVKNLEISPSIDIFNNASINSAPITEDLHPYTVRQVLGWLAALNGANAYIDSELNICFAAPKAANCTIQRSEVISENITEGSRVISQVLFDNGDLNPALSDETDPDAVFIETKLDLADSEAALAPINTKLKNFTYNGVTIKKQGTGRFELGDVVTYSTVDTEGNAISYTMLIGGIVYDFSGGFFSETLYSNADSRSEREFAGSKQSDPIADGGGGGTSTGGTTSQLAAYSYVDDTSVKVNNVTYTVEKDATSGLISKITSSASGELIPEISGTITDVALHNAVFWAVAISKGIPEKKKTGYEFMPIMDGITGYFIPETIEIDKNRWKNAINDENNMSISANAVLTEEGHLHLGEQQFGSYKTGNGIGEPLTVYVVFKTVTAPNDLTIRTIVSRTAGTSLGLISAVTQRAGSWLRGLNRDTLLSKRYLYMDKDKFHCICLQVSIYDDFFDIAEGNDPKQPVGKDYGAEGYQGEYTINIQHNGTNEAYELYNDAIYAMVAFGSTRHSESQMTENMEWLMAKYIGDEGQ